VCDLLMPRCNGFQFCRALAKNRASLPNTKIVVSSGSAYSVDKIAALESGADEYVTKPINVDQLVKTLERLTTIGNIRELHSNPAVADGITRVKFWGVRGSIPSPGPETAYYGGNT